MRQLLESTTFVIGIHSLYVVAFECATFNDVRILRDVYTDASGITPHAGLCVYTREEWLNGALSARMCPVAKGNIK